MENSRFVLLSAACLLLALCTSCSATTFTDSTRYTTPRGVRTEVVRAIRYTIRQLVPDRVYSPDYSLSTVTTVSGYRIRVTITYCTLCMERGNIPITQILGQDLINRCNGILADMLARYNQPYGTLDAFRPTSIRGIDQGVRLQYVANRIHDELRLISHRPSKDFISPPPVTDLSKVKVLKDGLRLHGQRPNSTQHQEDTDPGSVGDISSDYGPDDCPIDASYLVGNDDINGEELSSDQYLQSPGQSYYLSMQADCNLVLYDANNNVAFATGTDGKGQDCFTLMQTDCNLVVYDDGHNALWASNTQGAASDQLDCVLSVDDAGTITIWASVSGTTSAIWSA